MKPMMANLFAGLASALHSGSPLEIPEFTKPSTPEGLNYPIWRLRRSWIANGVFGSDESVLVRQIVRSAGGLVHAEQLARSIAPLLADAEVHQDDSGNLTAVPYVPEWVSELGVPSELDSAPCSRIPDEGTLAEPYIEEAFGYKQWKSRALKEACWKTLTAKAGSTVLVGLPTGSGKSLTFQQLARFSSGLTLVVVPTVALAIDQFRAAKEMPFLSHLDARYFAADDPEFPPAQVSEAVRSGSTRLLFASPEACVSGRLRFVLDDLASQGRLENVVIDEAHIVGSWGIYFRVDFQLLSSVWKRWHGATNHQLRTLLLSATFTPDCRNALRALFSSGTWSEFISQRLRPEIAYFSKQFQFASDRDAAVLESAWHLPRPMILYTTSVKDAVEWHTRLATDGFRRVESFTGKTSRTARRSLLTKWRADEIDVMVATSAFGLGVDKPDVRSVVHACLPEDLDRFYQEVGRAGRDGFSAVSVLLSTKKDYVVAKNLGPKLLRTQTIQDRWESIWGTRQVIDAERHRYRVAVHAKKAGLTGTRTYEENVRWNKRLLLQLLRAEQIEILSIGYDDDEDEDQQREWVEIELRFPPETRDIASLINAVRVAELGVLLEGFGKMEASLSKDARLCCILRDMYGKGTVRVCGGCIGCRRTGRLLDDCPPLSVTPSDFSNPVVHIVAGFPNMGRPYALSEWLRRANQTRGICRFACRDEYMGALLDQCKRAFGTTSKPYRVDGLGQEGPNWEMPFSVAPDEQLIIIHNNRVHTSSLHAKVGKSLVHWICGDCAPTDSRGKSWLDQPRIIPHISPDAWIHSGGENVH
jgi:ATP-dependent DNA helicase RecQ